MKRKLYRDIVFITLISMFVLFILMYAGRTISPVFPEEGSGEYRLPVFATSDIHGSFIYTNVQPYQYVMAYIADKVNDARRTENGIDNNRTVLIDGGDIYQGRAVSNLVQGESMSAVFDAMGYDAVTVGNHEFDWGTETVMDNDQTMRDYTLDGKAHKNEIPVVCCNLYQDGRKAEFVRDYVILDKTAVDASGEERDVRIAVIGFAEDYSISISDKQFKDLGYSISVDYDEANRIASELEESDECDATILLAHGAADTIANALGSSSAVDLVIGGHLHRNIDGMTEWGLRYMAPKGQGSSYLYSELVFENDGKGGARTKTGADDEAKIISLKDESERQYNIEENAEDLDLNVVDISNEYLDRISEYLNEEIGYITVPVTKTQIKGSGKRASTAGNFVTGAMIKAADADVAIINTSAMRGDLRIDPGKDRHIVTLADIYTMLPFDDILYCYELNYKELLDVFNYAMNTKGWALMTCMSGIDCYFIDDPTDDGSSGKYKRTVLDTLVKDGEVIYKDGKWKEGWADRTVRLVTIDYVGTTNRNGGGMDNPLCAYNDSDRLISHDNILRDSILEVLRREAEENNGLLPVDTEPHFIYRAYDEKQNAE